MPCYMKNISIGMCILVTFLDLFWLCLQVHLEAELLKEISNGNKDTIHILKCSLVHLSTITENSYKQLYFYP